MDFNTESIEVMKISLKTYNAKKYIFTNYEVHGDRLSLFGHKTNNVVKIVFDNGEFRDSRSPNMFIYKAMNDSARQVFSEILEK